MPCWNTNYKVAAMKTYGINTDKATSPQQGTQNRPSIYGDVPPTRVVLPLRAKCSVNGAGTTSAIMKGLRSLPPTYTKINASFSVALHT